MGVGLAHKLDGETDGPVADQERPRDQARLGPDLRVAVEPVDQREQDDAFQGCLVKLAGMPGQRAAGGENNAPGNLGDPAIKLGVHEVGDPAKE